MRLTSESADFSVGAPAFIRERIDNLEQLWGKLEGCRHSNELTSVHRESFFCGKKYVYDTHEAYVLSCSCGLDTDHSKVHNETPVIYLEQWPGRRLVINSNDKARGRFYVDRNIASITFSEEFVEISQLLASQGVHLLYQTKGLGLHAEGQLR